MEGEETTGAVGGNPVDEVDETHPEVIAIVGEAVKVAEAKDVELPAEVIYTVVYKPQLKMCNYLVTVI